MKKLLGILLITSVIGSYAGSCLWIRYQRHHHRREIKSRLARLNKKDLIPFSFTTEEAKKLDWHNPHEFEIDGKMYDVVEKAETNGQLSFLCWLDKEETKLNFRLKTLLEVFIANNKPINQTKNSLLSFFKKLFFSPIKEMDWKHNEQIDLRTTFLLSQYLSLTFSPPTPPPNS